MKQRDVVFAGFVVLLVVLAFLISFSAFKDEPSVTAAVVANEQVISTYSTMLIVPATGAKDGKLTMEQMDTGRSRIYIEATLPYGSGQFEVWMVDNKGTRNTGPDKLSIGFLKEDNTKWKLTTTASTNELRGRQLVVITKEPDQDTDPNPTRDFLLAGSLPDIT